MLWRPGFPHRPSAVRNAKGAAIRTTERMSRSGEPEAREGETSPDWKGSQSCEPVFRRHSLRRRRAVFSLWTRRCWSPRAATSLNTSFLVSDTNGPHARRSRGPLRGPFQDAKSAADLGSRFSPALTDQQVIQRATGLEPTTSSLGSVAKLTGALRKWLIINHPRPACLPTASHLLLQPQGFQRPDFRRSSRRQIARDEGRCHQHDDRDAERRQIDRSDAKELRSHQPRCRKPGRYAD